MSKTSDKPGKWSHKESDWDQKPPADMWSKIETKLDVGSTAHRGVFSMGLTKVAASAIVLVACVGLISYWIGYRQGGEDMVMERIMNLEEVAVSDNVGFYEKVEQGSQELYAQYRQRQSYASATSRKPLIIRDIPTETDWNEDISMVDPATRTRGRASTSAPMGSAAANASRQEGSMDDAKVIEPAVSRKRESAESITEDIAMVDKSSSASEPSVVTTSVPPMDESRDLSESESSIAADDISSRADEDGIATTEADTMPKENVRDYYERQRNQSADDMDSRHDHLANEKDLTSFYGQFSIIEDESKKKQKSSTARSTGNVTEPWLISREAEGKVRLIHGNYAEVFTIQGHEGNRTALQSINDPSKQLEIRLQEKVIELHWIISGEKSHVDRLQE